MINKDSVGNIKFLKIIDVRMARIVLKINSMCFNIVAVHFPILRIERDIAFRKLESNMKVDGTNIIIGDMNIRNDINENGLITIVKKYMFIDLALFRVQKLRCTRFARNSTPSRLDRVLVSKWSMTLLNLTYTSITSSDHVGLGIVFHREYDELCGSGLRKSECLLFVPNDYVILKKNLNFLNQCRSLLNLVKEGGVMWDIVKQDLKRKGIKHGEYNGYYTKKIDDRRSHLSVSLNSVTISSEGYIMKVQEMNELLKAQDELLHHKLKLDIINGAMTNKNLIIQRLKRSAKNQIYAISDDDNVYYEVKQLVKILQQHYLTNCKIKVSNDLLNNYFVNIANQKKLGYLHIVRTDPLSISSQNILNELVNASELNNAITTLRDSAMPGPDGLSAIVYKRLNAELNKLMISWINWLMLDDIPDEVFYKYNVASLIFFNKDKENSLIHKVDRLRPIAVLNVDIKIIHKILYSRIVKFCDNILPTSIVGIKGRSIASAFWAIHNIHHNRCRKFNKNPILMRLDFSKAFDKVNLDYLGRILRKYLGDNRTTRLIIKMVHLKSLCILVQKRMGIDFTPANGILQGSPLSTLLFSFYLLELMQALEKYVKGIKIQGLQRRFKAVSYVDDLSIFCDGQADVRIANSIVASFCRCTGAVINKEKSYLFDLNKNCIMRQDDFEGTENKILGFFFGRNGKFENKKIIDNIIMDIKSKVIAAKKLYQNIIDKVIAINTIWVPKLSYISILNPLTRGQYRKLEIIFSDFIWEKKRLRMNYTKMTYPTDFGGLNLKNVRILLLNNRLRSAVKYTFELSGINFKEVLQSWAITDVLCKNIIKQLEKVYQNIVEVEELKNYRTLYLDLLQEDHQILYYFYRDHDITFFKKLHLNNNMINFSVKASLGMLPTLSILSRRKILQQDSILCGGCSREEETIEHFYYGCNFYGLFIEHYMIICGVAMSCARKRFNSILDLINMADWRHKKFLLIVLKTLWNYRCKKIFSRVCDNLWHDIDTAIEQQFLTDFNRKSIQWLKKFWPMNILIRSKNLTDIISYIIK